MKTNDSSYLNIQAQKIRKLTIESIGSFGVGHIGGSVSVAETLSAIYFGTASVDPKNPEWKDRDRVILSKGHAGTALYSTLALKGYFDVALLKTLNQPNTTLPSHCDMLKTPGVDMTAGSLGQGLSAGIGIALACRLNCQNYTTYCILGDGEMQEGQVWEALMYCGNKKLNNLIVLVDNNKIQIDDFTDNINSLNPLDKKLKSFKFNVIKVNGHNADEVARAINKAKTVKTKPTAILLDTVKGKGVAFCEGLVSSHSVAFTAELLKETLGE